MGKDNSTKSELRKQVDKLNELVQKEGQNLEEVLESLRVENEKNLIMQRILAGIVNDGILGMCEGEITMDYGFSERVGLFLNEEDRKQCQEIFLGTDNDPKEELKDQLKEKMFAIFSKIVDKLAERTGLSFYLTEEYDIKISYSSIEAIVFFDDFKFEFAVDIR